MLTQNLNAVFRATDLCRSAVPGLMAIYGADSPAYAALQRLLKAHDDFEAHLKLPRVRAEGRREGQQDVAA